MTYARSWELDSLFPDGSASSQLKATIQKIKHDLLEFGRKFNQVSDVKMGILHYQELDGLCHDLQEFVSCLIAQNVEDQVALQLQSQITQLSADCASIGEDLNALLAEMDEQSFATLLADADMQSIRFHLDERRQHAREKLPAVQERLIHRLAMDGYQGWNALYGEFIGNLTLSSPVPSEPPLSVGQADNKLSHPDRKVRQAWFKKCDEAWSVNEHLVAQMLNHLAGFRLSVYQTRGWPSVLKEPLMENRMQEETLHTMWETIQKHKTPLLKYLEKKAQLMGLEKLAWSDVEAPLPHSPQVAIPFDEAAQIIIEAFQSFSPSMSSFAQEAFERKWIEAEDRSKKRPGGFCVSFTHAKQSRIFMTYSGTMTNVFTLAHELGHAYHSDAVKEMPPFLQQYKMNVAETASTLAEMVVIDFMLNHKREPHVRRALLDCKLQRAVIFLMNIHARFLFELNFYEARRKNYVLPAQLNELMENAQRNAYEDALAEWHPHFWISKQHFYATDVPFYNFPYTFGYLFSQGIYAHLKDQGNRDRQYAALLQDTGNMTVESLAQKHLGVNLNEPHFWESALRLIENDAHVFIKSNEIT